MSERNAAGQRKIVHYCSCGLAPHGNGAWRSHQNARPDHRQITYIEFLEMNGDLPEWWSGITDEQRARMDKLIAESPVKRGKA